MTEAEFMAWAADELENYKASPEFKTRVAAVLERQKAGEDLSIEQIAAALQIPLWLAELSMLTAIQQTQARIILPENGKVN